MLYRMVIIVALFAQFQSAFAVKNVVWAGKQLSEELHNATLEEKKENYNRDYDFNCHMNWRQAEDPSLYVTKPPCENDKVYMVTGDDSTGSRRFKAPANIGPGARIYASTFGVKSYFRRMYISSPDEPGTASSIGTDLCENGDAIVKGSITVDLGVCGDRSDNEYDTYISAGIGLFQTLQTNDECVSTCPPIAILKDGFILQAIPSEDDDGGVTYIQINGDGEDTEAKIEVVVDSNGHTTFTVTDKDGTVKNNYNSLYCNGNGQVGLVDAIPIPTCVTCDDGYVGPACQYTNDNTCNGNGEVAMVDTKDAISQGKCDDDNYVECCNGKCISISWVQFGAVGYRVNDGTDDCSDGSDETTPPFQCSKPVPTCVTCDDGYVGPACQYTNDNTCNGNGQVAMIDTENSISQGKCDDGDQVECCNGNCIRKQFPVELSDGVDDCGDGSDETTPPFQCSKPAPTCVTCDDGYVGPACQYTNGNTCNGNGQVAMIDTENSISQGKCDDGDQVECCNGNCIGRFPSALSDGVDDCGDSSDETTPPFQCSKPTPTCVTCDDGYVGPACQYTNGNTCNGNGQVAMIDTENSISQGKCDDGDQVECCTGKCIGRFPSALSDGVDDCGDSSDETTPPFQCSKPTPTCTCAEGFAGVTCEFNNGDGLTCSGNGKIVLNMSTGVVPVASCVCDEGHAGSQCQHSRAKNCNNLGAPLGDGTCTDCDEGNAGPRCEYSDTATCNTAGTANKDGTCTCLTGYSGVDCTEAGLGYAMNSAMVAARAQADDKKSLGQVLPATLGISTAGAVGAYVYLLKFGGDPNGATTFSELPRQAHMFVGFNVWLRLLDCQTDWGFYFIAARSAAFEAVYGYDGIANGRGQADIPGRYESSVSSFQAASLIFCTAGTFLTAFDIWGSAQRLAGVNYKTAMKITVAVWLFEDLPQFVLNVIYMDTITSAPGVDVDPVSVLSLIASVVNMVFAFFLIYWDSKGKAISGTTLNGESFGGFDEQA